MCKVLMIAGIKKEHRKNAATFISKMGTVMSRGNNDGIGYAAVNSAGQLFGQRWLNNDDVWKQEHKVPNTAALDTQVVNTFSEALTNPEVVIPVAKPITDTTKFGTSDWPDVVAITLHTRMATSSKGMQNTHPFVDEAADTSLIHNGIISNTKDFNFKLSTCDSEAILISYLKHNVNLNITDAQKMANDLVGYYACGVFSRDAQGNRIMDIFKGHNNNLEACFIPELGTWAMSTNGNDIKQVCSELGWSVSTPYSFKDGAIMRMNTVTGECITTAKFEVGKRYETFHSGQTGSRTTGSTQATDYSPTRYEQSGHNSYDGATVLEFGKANKPKNLSDAHIKYLQLRPKIEEYSAHERDELAKGISMRA